MARSSTVELDFFGMAEKEATAPKLPTTASPKLFERRRSFRDIQSMISKINPEVLKTVIASGSAKISTKQIAPTGTSFSVDQKSFTDQQLPLFAPVMSCDMEKDRENALMTIFYNGSVAVFDVPPIKAEKILGLAEGANLQLLETSHGDLPITRRKSLERFLEKRKERMTMVSPYGFSKDNELSSNKAEASN